MSGFCHWFGVNSVQTTGVIIEYNPLHGGHIHMLEETRRQLGADTAVIGVMSGDFVQRGDFAILRKQARARAAVESGVDLVLELPLPWAVASAERFPDGGVQVLQATGLVTHLAFGSECGEIEPLRCLAETLLSKDLDALVKQELEAGVSYAAARQRAVERLTTSETAALLESANNVLGVEYCKALLKRNSDIEPLTVRRSGSGHDAALREGEHPSGSAIRQLLRDGDREAALDRMAPAMRRVYEAEEAAGRAPVLAETCQRAILAHLRSMSGEDFAKLDEGREGLYNRLYDAARSACSVEELLEAAKTKRYAYARLRRMVLWAWLGLVPAELPAEVPYLRVLAANETGRQLLSRMKKTAALPILTKPNHIRRLDAAAQELFELEARAADLYALAYPDLSAAAGGRAWREGPEIL